MPLSIRPAVPGDHEAVARLFLELGTGDPVPSRERFEREMMATTLIAEDGDGGGDPIAGYAYFQRLEGVTYVRHVVSDKAARRRGVGRALMAAIAEGALATGQAPLPSAPEDERPPAQWCLNVKPDNVAAVRLYEACGLRATYRTWAMRLPWSALAGVAAAPVRPIEPADEAGVTAAFGLVPGLLADARAKGRVLVRTDDSVAVFDPDFPGAYPFRSTPAEAQAFLAALAPHAKHDFVGFVIEGQPDVRDALLEAGATVRFEIDHMVGEVEAFSSRPA